MIEKNYIAKTSIELRKKYGQYFTPELIAKLMIRWITKNKPFSILDPSFGLGIFYREYLKQETIRKSQFDAYEIDPEIVKFYKSYYPDHQLNIINEDFLLSTTKKYDSIICNPPYIKFKSSDHWYLVIESIENDLGVKLSKNTNQASLFLLKSLTLLKKNGHLAFVLPYDFFNANYGSVIKEYLVDNHLLKQILLLSNEHDFFPEVKSTFCILLCRNDDKKDPIGITKINSQDEIQNNEDISFSIDYSICEEDLPCDSKWTNKINSLYVETMNVPQNFVKLSYYGKIKRGLATGANDFFALSKSMIIQYRISEENFCKCITKSNQVTKAVFTNNDFDILSDKDKKVFCFDVSNLNDSATQKYISYGESKHYHQRFLTKHRKFWFKNERRMASPLMFGTFCRDRLKVVKNCSDALTFTCFHNFYSNDIGSKYIDKLFVYFISNIGQKILLSNKRELATGLYKFEPGDLNESYCPHPDFFDMINDEDLHKIIEVAHNDFRKAIQMSNEIFRDLV